MYEIIVREMLLGAVCLCTFNMKNIKTHIHVWKNIHYRLHGGI